MRRRRSASPLITSALLSKGSLALHACDVVSGVDGWTLSAVVPNDLEPDWDMRLSVESPRRWPRARLVRSGDWRELVGDGHDLIVNVLYNKIIGRKLIEDSGRIINCHPGRLPEYRGVRPASWSLFNVRAAMR
ncbi:Formyl transferase [Amycolatopsis marina]|uniref:Formyl transferase n=1 Tax=Amycolatopsis marina TaxID=490629 RepID=A0A1I1ASR1_9PSEU|nr:Formyl transferase [Amycolatopsis marina]